MSEETDIIIHDEYGFRQVHRRALLDLTLCEFQAEALRDGGARVTWAEDADGVTVSINGQEACRITYAELAAIEVRSDWHSRRRRNA